MNKKFQIEKKYVKLQKYITFIIIIEKFSAMFVIFCTYSN